MQPKFKVGDRVLHITFDICYTVEKVAIGQAQFFYELRQDANTLIKDVAESELELSNE